MADISSTRDSVRAAFRDFRVEGVPASGEYEPDKSEIRAAVAGKMVDLIAEVAASAVAGRRVFVTLAERDAWTDRPIGAVAYVEETGETYRWSGAAWEAFEDPTVEAAARASADADRAEQAADAAGALIGERVGEMTMLEDERGWAALGFDEAGQMFTSHANFMAGGEAFEIADEKGFVLAAFSATGGLIVAEPSVETAAPWDAAPIFGSLLCGVEGVETHLYLRNMMVRRSDEPRVRGVFSSNGETDGSRQTYVRVSDDDLVLELSRSGATAQLMLRSAGDVSGLRNQTTLTVAVAPTGASASATILMIGDSITNRGQAALVRDRLTAWGVTPSMIGTINGALPESGQVTGEGGAPGEGREGWEFGDYTGAILDRALIVSPGSEADYLALPKDTRREYNPFLRAATGGDAPAVVRNGYVFDFAYYLSRFSLAAPDIVLIGLGTNDIRDRNGAALIDAVTDGMAIMHTQIRASASSARIFFWFPPSARSPGRDALWEIKYAPVIKAMIAYQRAAADPNLHIIPAWAMANQEIGWSLMDAAVNPATGVSSSVIDDDIHPRDTTRQQLAEVLAAYAACAAHDLI